MWQPTKILTQFTFKPFTLRYRIQFDQRSVSDGVQNVRKDFMWCSKNKTDLKKNQVMLLYYLVVITTYVGLFVCGLLLGSTPTCQVHFEGKSGLTKSIICGVFTLRNLASKQHVCFVAVQSAAHAMRTKTIKQRAFLR